MQLPEPRLIVVGNDLKSAMLNPEKEFMEIDNDTSGEMMLCKTELETQGSQGVQRATQ